MASSKIQALWNHPAGPKTSELVICQIGKGRLAPYDSRRFVHRAVPKVHFWAPTFKWGISIANIADFSKPPENISYPQQIAVTATGVIWSRYSTVITPKNWNLFSVNVVMAGTGLYQLGRKIQHDYFSEAEAEPAVVKE